MSFILDLDPIIYLHRPSVSAHSNEKQYFCQRCLFVENMFDCKNCIVALTYQVI